MTRNGPVPAASVSTASSELVPPWPSRTVKRMSSRGGVALPAAVAPVYDDVGRKSMKHSLTGIGTGGAIGPWVQAPVSALVLLIEDVPHLREHPRRVVRQVVLVRRVVEQRVRLADRRRRREHREQRAVHLRVVQQRRARACRRGRSAPSCRAGRRRPRRSRSRSGRTASAAGSCSPSPRSTSGVASPVAEVVPLFATGPPWSSSFAKPDMPAVKFVTLSRTGTSVAACVPPNETPEALVVETADVAAAEGGERDDCRRPAGSAPAPP